MSLFFGALSPQAPYPSTFSQLFPAETLEAMAHVEDRHPKTMTNSYTRFSGGSLGRSLRTRAHAATPPAARCGWLGTCSFQPIYRGTAGRTLDLPELLSGQHGYGGPHDLSPHSFMTPVGPLRAWWSSGSYSGMTLQSLAGLEGFQYPEEASRASAKRASVAQR